MSFRIIAVLKSRFFAGRRSETCDAVTRSCDANKTTAEERQGSQDNRRREEIQGALKENCVDFEFIMH